MLFIIHHLPKEGDTDRGEHQFRTAWQLRLDDTAPQAVQNQVSSTIAKRFKTVLFSHMLTLISA